jgi:hypothetical protein
VGLEPATVGEDQDVLEVVRHELDEVAAGRSSVGGHVSS